MELMTVIVVIGILFLLIMPSYSFLRGRAERAKCVSNLHSLYAAASAYVTDQGAWPQIPVDDIDDPAYSQAWIDAFTPYKISRVNWICQTIQKVLGDPPYEDAKHARIDYVGTPFDDKPESPRQWPNHPWFLERGNVHGDGNLIIFTNGQIKTLNEAKKDAITLPPTYL